jgi:hypothetical protein
LFGKGVDSLTGVNLANYKIEKDINGKGQWEMVELYNWNTKKVCLDNQVKVIDMANLFPKNSLYFYDHIHYTNEGAEKFAEILSGALPPLLPALTGNF